MSKYYIAVDDETAFIGDGNDMKNGTLRRWFDKSPGKYDCRIFLDKFQKSPEDALKYAYINFVRPNFEKFSQVNFSKFSRNKFASSKFFKDTVVFDEQTQCYVFYEYHTLNSLLPPKEEHFKKFLDGEFKFRIVRHEIQILSTEIETVNDVKSIF